MGPGSRLLAMTTATGRLLLAAFVCVALTTGGAGVVAAAHGEDGAYDADLDVEGDVDLPQADGNGTYDCVGDVTLRHHCDKDASVEVGPLSVDYFGDNWAEPSALRGGGGDVVTVGVAEQNVTAGFDCLLQAAPEQPCGVVTDADDYDGPPE